MILKTLVFLFIFFLSEKIIKKIQSKKFLKNPRKSVNNFKLATTIKVCVLFVCKKVINLVGDEKSKIKIFLIAQQYSL